MSRARDADPSGHLTKPPTTVIGPYGRGRWAIMVVREFGIRLSIVPWLEREVRGILAAAGRTRRTLARNLEGIEGWMGLGRGSECDVRSVVKDKGRYVESSKVGGQWDGSRVERGRRVVDRERECHRTGCRERETGVVRDDRWTLERGRRFACALRW